MRRATIRDVAAAAGVSLSTASRALNRAGRVSSQTIQAVARASRQLGYEPDAIAQSMRTRSTGVVGVLVSDFANPLYARILTAVEATLQTAGYTLLLASTHNSTQREKELIDTFRRRRVDGLILGPCEEEAPQLLHRLQAELPVIALDRDLAEGGTGVQVDHQGGALAATRYLLNLGHTRIALMTPGDVLRPGRDRIAGYRAAHQERGLAADPALLCARRSAMDLAFSEALALLSMPAPPTALLCLGTRILAGALQALRHCGRPVPAHTSVISIGDTDLSQLFSPAITSLTWDFEAVGTAAAQLLLQRLGEGSTAAPQRLTLVPRLVLRESCAAVPAGPADPA